MKANVLSFLKGVAVLVFCFAVSGCGKNDVQAPDEKQTLLVPATHASIQAAINASRNGDEVIVAPGIYNETITFNGRDITVRSADPLDSAVVAGTVINGGQNGTVVTFNNGETREAVLAGFTITGGQARTGQNGGGILIGNASSPTIKNNVITQNTAQYGAGANVTNQSAPLFEENIFSNNTATGGRGAALYVTVESEPEIIDNIIINHTGGDGVIHIGGSNAGHKASAVITGNTISGNSTHFGTGGIKVTVSSAAVIVGNTITDNQGASDNAGGAISIISNSSADISGNTITGNKGSRVGAIVVNNNADAPVTVINGNTISDNEAGNEDDYGTGGGILVTYHGNVEITNNTITGNKAWNTNHGGGGIAVYDWGQNTKALINGNTITGNQAFRWGGGIYLRGSGVDVTVTNNTILNNSALGHTSQADGGGIYVNGKQAVIFNNTISSNSAGRFGGGVYIYNDVPVYGDNDVAWERANSPAGDEANNTYEDNTHGDDTHGGANVFFRENM